MSSATSTGHDVEKTLPEIISDGGHVSEKVLAHSHDADEAMKAFMSHEGQVLELDEATNKRILRRIDWNLMPVRSSSDNPTLPH